MDTNDLWEIAETASISPTAVIGSPFRPLLQGNMPKVEKCIISDNAHIGHFCVVGMGAKIKEGTIVDDYSKIETNATVGPRTLVIYRATICSDCVVGSDCVIGGFITERTHIGSHSRIFGEILHRHPNMDYGWDADEAREDSPLIGEGVFVGFGAKIIGPISIGDNSYISAGSIVTKDIPEDSYVSGHNQIQHKR